MMRAPVRMLDSRSVIVVVVVVVVLRQVDVRRWQHGRKRQRCNEERGRNRPAHVGRDHAEILLQSNEASISEWYAGTKSPNLKCS